MIIDIPRADGTNDTAVLKFVWPRFFGGPHYELQGPVKRGTRPGAVAAEIERTSARTMKM